MQFASTRPQFPSRDPVCARKAVGNVVVVFSRLAQSAHLYLPTCVLPHAPSDGVAMIFPLLLYRGLESSPHWLSCTSFQCGR